MEIENARIKIVYSIVGDCVMLKQFNKEKSGKWRPWNTVLLPREFIRHLTPLALDKGDSAAPEGDTSPEVLSAGQAGSTPALCQ